MDLSRFRRLLGNPLVNGDSNRDWSDLEARIEVELPEDYKEFISAYGAGCLNDQMLLFHPKGDPVDGLRLEVLMKSAHSAYSMLRERSPELYPYPIHPDDGGCIAIGRSYGGNHLFLSPPGPESGQWGIVVEMGEWAVFDLSFTDFLWQALNGEIFLPVIYGEPSFEPISAMSE
ncbi:SMI1/KNR4 family protein [Streptomyces sp. NPDC059567]|uniref:SMI1/KNR4 family protein n=1 Tax=Streptomyces sp. NPDC059567 TaxID=3346867 RepID=UPI0036ACC771